MSQRSDHPAIQRFLGGCILRSSFYAVLDANEEEPRARLVALKAVETYFTEDNYRNLKDILHALFPDRDSLPIYPEQIVPDFTGVFCILLRIGCGVYILHCCEFDIRDGLLPLSPSNPPPNFPVWTEGESILSRFCREQPVFCAPKLGFRMTNKWFEAGRILPIIHKDYLKSGGSGKLYHIKIHQDFRDQFPSVDRTSSNSSLVLKTYFTNDAEKHYNNEREAYMRLPSTPNIIKYYGSYRHGQTFNLVLEYANRGTLEEYFRNQASPRSGEDIISFWEKLFNILEALHCIHNVTRRNSSDGQPGLQGWHQDVTPANILATDNGVISTPYKWNFKLADLGQSHFEISELSPTETVADDSQGTRTYGAPECYRPNDVFDQRPLKVTQSVDIWSLGCVFSESVRWLADGYSGIEEYRKERASEIEQIPNFRDADCFHDGEKVLKSVQVSHDTSLLTLSVADFITKRVIDNMIEEMLGEAAGRPTAKGLSIKSGRIIDKARKDLENFTRQSSTISGVGVINPSNTFPRQPPVLPPGFHPYPATQNFGTGAEHLTHGANHRLEHHERGLERFNKESSSEDEEEAIGPVASRASTTPSATQPMNPNRRHPPPFTTSVSDGQVGYQGDSALVVGGRDHDNSGFGVPNVRRPHVQPRGVLNRDPESATPTHGRNASDIPHSSQPLVPQASPPNAPPRRRGTVHGTGHVQSLSALVSQQISPISGYGIHHVYDEIPSLSIDQLLEWKQDRKRKVFKPLEGIRFKEQLDQRDHAFLIDDSHTMSEHSREVKKVFEGLSYLVKDADPDGIELFFTNSSQYGKSKNTTSLLAMMDHRKHVGLAAIEYRLEKILEKYREKLVEQSKQNSSFTWLRGQKKSVRPLSLYILTNGIWQSRSEFDIQLLIKRLVDELLMLRLPKSQVGIQLISFGDDPIGLARLKFLDTGLEQGLDIVDTEPSTGKVWKMVLGAIYSSFDGEGELNGAKDSIAAGSPQSTAIAPNIYSR